MDVLVFGAGSLGSLLGGLLAREHEVTLVGRDPHMRAIDEGGLHITGDAEATVRPTARLDAPESAELAVVCVKSFDTGAAATALADCALDACLSVQNGMGNEAVLADRLECPVLAGTCTYGAVRPEPGTVRCTGIGELTIGPPEGGTSALVERVGQVFEAASVATAVVDDMPARLVEKLAVNAGINATTALARLENGAVIGGDAGALAGAAAREAAAVARAEGIDLSDRAAERALESVAADTAANTSSMHQDLLAGRRTEVDAINGYVVGRADELGVDAPVNRTFARLLRAWEAGQGLR
ncbi:2-dehydropantoate 2-reductase [Natronomonas moolapensis 8.8.11]|uniref:2-dehydropantoate 2-reductase n=1 Tax=Natronomonas moolapensis (strain DSM 18674 / CECT 7526 / JCM 14361 / 8.8.11) TaxID=268739 RepID=M1XKE9_NATM8|nr:2-dehydropantoate 2-reductase [Natronomonas moolapensis]CCQ35769.1 2-dehydropantoate 2-reductase [Natronomonas moolapensis 8.8.11]